MKNKKSIIKIAFGGLLFSMAAGLMINYHLIKHYKKGDQVEGTNAYFVKESNNPIGHIKADKYITPVDNYYDDQLTRSSSNEFIGHIESAWEYYTGAGTKVAIIDDGFDYNHPEFKRSDNSSAILLESGNFFITEVNNKETVLFESFADNPSCIDEDWDSEEGEWATHGTATSTSAAAPMNNDGGVGIAPDADILALKIDFTFDTIECAINYAIEQGVDVINMSLGAYADYNFIDGWGDAHNTNSKYGEEGYAEIAGYLEEACQAAYDAGIIVVAAAGNEATWHKSYPACNAHVVAAGAIGDWDNKGNADKLAEFTNYVGSSQTGEVNVDILAPGYVYTAHKSGTQSSPTHIYDDTQGTSFSSPIVAGAACLWKQKNPTGTPDQFLADLQSTADGIGTYKNKMVPVSGWYSNLTDVGPSNITNGRLNISRLLGVEPYVYVDSHSESLCINDTKQINVTSHNGSVTYTSSNTSIATVSNSGFITAVAAGDTTITVNASASAQNASTTINVHVINGTKPTAMSFDPDSVTLDIGDEYNAEETIVMTPSNAARGFLFESNDESVATVDIDTGLVTAVGAGSTTIYALSGYGDDVDAELTVNVNQGELPTTWNKVTSTSELTNGEYLLVYENGNKVFNGGLTTLDATYNTIGVTINNNKIAYNETTTAAKFTIASVTGGYSIKSASGYYIGRTANSNGLDASATVYTNTITVSSGVATITGAGGKILSFNTASDQQRFRYMGNASNIALYKGQGGSTPTPAKTLSSITLDTSSVKKSFSVDETFSYSGLVVTAHYSDESSATVTPTSVSTPDMSTAGNKTVTVTYTESTVTKTATYNITVVASGSTQNFNTTYNMDNLNTSWSLSNASDSGDYMLCPSTGTNSIASIAGIFEGKNITSNVVITLNVATFGSGTNPTASSFEIHSNLTATSKVTASQSGSIPSTSTFTNAIYTVSLANATESFVDDLAVKIIKPGKQIRLKSINVTFTYTNAAPKVINSLQVSYTGGSVYVGGTLDESKVSVTAKHTDSTRYKDVVLSSSDYSITGFDSSSAGNKTVTVTYTGSVSTSSIPLTTTFEVTVIEDNVKYVNVTNTKTYHPGETIAKSDITVTLTFDSDKVETTTDFTFANDGYQFTYDDAASGGNNTNKQFSITYGGQTYNFTVKVSRNAYIVPTGNNMTLTGAQGKTGGITNGTYSNADDYDSVYIGGVECAATGIYIYNNTYFSFGKAVGELHSISALSRPIIALNLTVQSGARTDAKLYVSVTGENNTWVNVDDADFAGNNYYYFKVAYESTSSSYSNFSSINITLKGTDTALNVANYIMYEDTNNQCTTKLASVIGQFENMSKAERLTFMTSTDYVIQTARTRLEAWLTNQHKSINLVDGDYVIANNIHSLSIFSDSNNENMIIVMSASFLFVSLIGCLYLLKKKHA